MRKPTVAGLSTYGSMSDCKRSSRAMSFMPSQASDLHSQQSRMAIEPNKPYPLVVDRAPLEIYSLIKTTTLCSVVGSDLIYLYGGLLGKQ